MNTVRDEILKIRCVDVFGQFDLCKNGVGVLSGETVGFGMSCLFGVQDIDAFLNDRS